MRLIDADLLLAVVETGRRNLPIPDNDGVLRKYLDWDGVKYLIERTPTIDAFPVVNAKWETSEFPDEKYRCSACGGACWYYDYHGAVARSRFCPNCGAKMDEKEADHGSD